MFAGRTFEQDVVAGVRMKGRLEIKPALPAPKGLRTPVPSWPPDGAKTAGHKDKPIVVLHAVDSALINPVGWVVVDLLKRASFNVEDRISGWATVAQRRTSKESIERGGWSLAKPTSSTIHQFTLGNRGRGVV